MTNFGGAWESACDMTELFGVGENPVGTLLDQFEPALN